MNRGMCCKTQYFSLLSFRWLNKNQEVWGGQFFILCFPRWVLIWEGEDYIILCCSISHPSLCSPPVITCLLSVQCCGELEPGEQTREAGFPCGFAASCGAVLQPYLPTQLKVDALSIELYAPWKSWCLWREWKHGVFLCQTFLFGRGTI